MMMAMPNKGLKLSLSVLVPLILTYFHPLGGRDPDHPQYNNAFGTTKDCKPDGTICFIDRCSEEAFRSKMMLGDISASPYVTTPSYCPTHKCTTDDKTSGTRGGSGGRGGGAGGTGGSGGGAGGRGGGAGGSGGGAGGRGGSAGGTGGSGGSAGSPGSPGGSGGTGGGRGGSGGAGSSSPEAEAPTTTSDSASTYVWSGALLLVVSFASVLESLLT